MYGWDSNRKEKLKEFDDLIKHQLFIKSWRQKEVLLKYYKVISEGREDEITKVTDLLPDGVNYGDPDDSLGKLKNGISINLEKYYSTKEGKGTTYRIYYATHLHLGIVEKEKNDKEATITSTPVDLMKALDFNMLPLASLRLKERLLNFLKIFPEAWFFPKNLVARSTSSGAFNWDTIILHVVALLVSISIFFVYLAKFPFSPQSFDMVKLLRQEAIEVIFSIMILYQFIAMPILTSILWGIYKKVAKSSTGYLETLNYQFYFLSAWLPLLFWFLLARLMHQMFGEDILLFLFSIFMVAAGLYWIWRHFQGISLLMGVQGKKRFLPFLCYMATIVAYVKLFS